VDLQANQRAQRKRNRNAEQKDKVVPTSESEKQRKNKHPISSGLQKPYAVVAELRFRKHRECE